LSFHRKKVGRKQRALGRERGKFRLRGPAGATLWGVGVNPTAIGRLAWNFPTNVGIRTLMLTFKDKFTARKKKENSGGIVEKGRNEREEERRQVLQI